MKARIKQPTSSASDETDCSDAFRAGLVVARLRELAKTGSEFNGSDICIDVPGGEIAVREYPNEREIAVLNYGLAQRKDQPFCIALAFLA